MLQARCVRQTSSTFSSMLLISSMHAFMGAGSGKYEIKGGPYYNAPFWHRSTG